MDAAGVPVQKEPTHFLKKNTQKRVDLVLHNLGGQYGTRPVAVAVSVPNTLRPDCLALSKYDATTVVQRTAQAKVQKYTELCQAVDASFVPAIISSSGTMDKSFTALVKHLSELIKKNSCSDELLLSWPTLTHRSYWTAKLCCAVTAGMGRRVVNLFCKNQGIGDGNNMQWTHIQSRNSDGLDGVFGAFVSL